MGSSVLQSQNAMIGLEAAATLSAPKPWQVQLYLLPLWLAAFVCAMQLTLSGVGIAVLILAAIHVMSIGGRGCYLVLAVTYAGWLGFCIALGNLLIAATGEILVAFATVIIIWWATFCAVRIGCVWGNDRLRRMQVRGRPMREWEWVYTGRDFAMSHPLSDRLGAVWCVVAFVVVHWLLQTLLLWTFTVSFFSVLLWLISTALAATTVCCLRLRHPAAWVLVWWPLVTGFPLSLPLLFYWVEGVRPNLIYRHRFERLVPPRRQRGALSEDQLV